MVNVGRNERGRFIKGHTGFYRGKNILAKVEEIKELYENRYSLNDIAKRFNVSKQAIKYWMDKKSIRTRKQGEHTERSKYKISAAHKGIKTGYSFPKGHKDMVPKEARVRAGKKISVRLKGRIMGPEWRRKIGESRIGRKASLESRKKMSERMKKEYEDPEFIKKVLGRRLKSSLEIKFENIINQLGLPYKFVGNGCVVIARKVPDFVDVTGKKVAIEVFCRKHKELFRGGLNAWKAERARIFNEHGWKIMFFDETEINTRVVQERLT